MRFDRLSFCNIAIAASTTSPKACPISNGRSRTRRKSSNRLPLLMMMAKRKERKKGRGFQKRVRLAQSQTRLPDEGGGGDACEGGREGGRLFGAPYETMGLFNFDSLRFRIYDHSVRLLLAEGAPAPSLSPPIPSSPFSAASSKRLVCVFHLPFRPFPPALPIHM